MSRPPLALLVLVAGCMSTGKTADTKAQRPTTRQRISLNQVEAPAAAVLAALAKQAKVPVEVGPAVKGILSAQLDQVPWDDALDAIVAALGVHAVWDGEGVRVTKAKPPAGEPFAPLPGDPPAPKEAATPRAGMEILQLTAADVRRVLPLMARFESASLVVAPDVAGAVTLDLRKVGFLACTEAIARTLGLSARRKHGVVVVTARRLAWGDYDLDGRPVPRPPRRDLSAPPRNRLQARSVLAETWLLLLARLAGRDVMIGGKLDGRLDVDLEDHSYEQALFRAAVRHKVGLAREGNLVRLRPHVRPVVRARTRPPVKLTLPLSGGGTTPIAIQATVVDPRRSKTFAVISDRIYGLGDALVEAGTVRLKAVTAAGVQLAVDGVDDPLVIEFPPKR